MSSLGLAILLTFAAVVLAVFALAPAVQTARERGRHKEPGFFLNKKQQLKEQSGLYRLTLPIVETLGYWSRKIQAPELRRSLQIKLLHGGNPGGYTPDDFLGVSVLSALFFSGVALFFSWALTGGFNFVLLLLFFALGIFYPWIWLDGQVKMRVIRANRSLPYALDLLNLAVEAGLDFLGALGRIVGKGKPDDPLIQELFYTQQEIRMGKTRREALRNLTKRLPSQNLADVAGSIIQAEQLGTPLGTVLKVQATVLRTKRTQTAEKAAQQAPVKIIFPLLFIFSATFLMLFGGFIVRWIRGEIF